MGCIWVMLNPHFCAAFTISQFHRISQSALQFFFVVSPLQLWTKASPISPTVIPADHESSSTASSQTGGDSRKSRDRFSAQKVSRASGPYVSLHPMTDPAGAGIYGVTWIPSIYPLYVSIEKPAPWIRHGYVSLCHMVLCYPEASHGISPTGDEMSRARARTGALVDSGGWFLYGPSYSSDQSVKCNPIYGIVPFGKLTCWPWKSPIFRGN